MQSEEKVVESESNDESCGFGDSEYESIDETEQRIEDSVRSKSKAEVDDRSGTGIVVNQPLGDCAHHEESISLFTNSNGDMLITSTSNDEMDMYVSDLGDILVTSKYRMCHSAECGVAQALIEHSIIPKFKQALGTFPISTQSQDLILWRLVMSWSDLLPAELLAQSLEQIFFPRWLLVLEDWLNLLPNHQDVLAWCSDWEQSLPFSVLKFPGVAGPLKQAQVAIKCQLSRSNHLASIENSILLDK